MKVVEIKKEMAAHGLQVLPDEVKHLDENRTVVMKNGNSLFMLGVYHNLHCLVSLFLRGLV